MGNHFLTVRIVSSLRLLDLFIQSHHLGQDVTQGQYIKTKEHSIGSGPNE